MALETDPILQPVRRSGILALVAGGEWTVHHAPSLEALVIDAEKLEGGGTVVIDVSQISRLDTFGAWLIERLRRSFMQPDAPTRITGLSADYSSLVAEVGKVGKAEVIDKSPRTIKAMLQAVGEAVLEVGGTFKNMVAMVGAMLFAIFNVFRTPRSFRLTSTVHHLERVGWHAVPIILLITFLIGCILAQQGIFHFRRFGAEVFVVDMVGVLVMREIGVLIVAIMIAGRSGSAYTAELGSMKMREEIDALTTMGFDPVEVLILPRILALLIALPILTFLGSMSALYGGGLVAYLYGGMEPEIFIGRLRDTISLDHFMVGMIKAPVMALVIGIVAAVEGLAVRGSADSLGEHTTASVVKAIFFVIVMDGAFAIFFASIGR
jgi:phospholipid/cholesterol/gamma-HCH transport system permease protein